MNNDAHLAYRVRVLPTQLDRARRRYAALVAEARRLRMNDILTKPEATNHAWEREVLSGNAN